MANHKVCDLCGATYGWGETCDCVAEAKREATAKEIEKKVQATMQLVLARKRGKKNGRNASNH
jgi:hypothetical protein